MATLLEWKPEYSVGVAAVDHEHQELITAINDVFDETGAAVAGGAVEEALGDIYNTIAAHFALEENLMRKSGYAEYQAHKDEHEDLLEQLRDIMDGYANDPRSARRDLASRLGDWFSGHFSTFDARLHGELGV